LRLDAGQRHGRGQRALGIGVRLEAAGGGGLGVGLVALRVQRRLAALGRSERDVGAGVLENVIRRGELFEPEAGFLAGIAQLVMRCQHHQYFHGISVLVNLQ